MDIACRVQERLFSSCPGPSGRSHAQSLRPLPFQHSHFPPRPLSISRAVWTGRSGHVVLAQRQSEGQRRAGGPQFPPILRKKQQTGPPGRKPPEDGGTKDAWGFLDFAAYQQRWDVPWGVSELILGLGAWFGSFVLVGIAFVPGVELVLGAKGFASLAPADKANLLLINQLIETAVGLAVINFTVRAFRPLPDGVLRADLSGPLKKPDGWLVWGVLGGLSAPLVVGAIAIAAQAIGYDSVGGRGTAEGVASIISLDLPTYLRLFTVTAILAPVLEETVFRGFLLTTLTKYMPVPAAVLLSAVAFGTAHISPRDFPQLTALGVLLGFTYVRSRNLLSPMLIHGLWNGTVLTVLFFLASSGVDVQEFLANGYLHAPLNLMSGLKLLT